MNRHPIKAHPMDSRRMSILLTFLILSLSSCTSTKWRLKNERKHSFTSTELSSIEKINLRNNSQALLIRDSLNEDLVVEIIPTGKFNYSLERGFEGSATAIKLWGKRSGTTESMETNESSTVAQVTQQHAVHKQNEETVNQTEQFSSKFNFYLYLLGAILIVGVWIWWRFRK